MKPLLFAALAGFIACSSSAASKPPTDVPAMTAAEILAMLETRRTAPCAYLSWVRETGWHFMIWDDGAGGVLGTGASPEDNFQIHPKRIDFSRISKELSDAVLEQADKTSANISFRGPGGGPHPDYRSGPVKPEFARRMIRRLATTLLPEERERIRELFLMCPLLNNGINSNAPLREYVPDRILEALSESFGMERVRLLNVRTIDSPDVFEIMGEQTEFFAINFSDAKEGANPVQRIRCVVSDRKDAVTLIRPETEEQDLTALLDRAGVTVRTAAEAERLAQAHAALLHRSFLRGVKTETTTDGFVIRAERKEGWSQAKGVTAMEFRIKLGPEKRVAAFESVPGKQSTEP